MKKLLLPLFFMMMGFITQAQELQTDQNPNYKLALEKYKANDQSLQSTMNTTLQNTYKAYDWRTAKNERRAERIADRRQRRYYNGFNNAFFNPYNNGFNNRYGNYNNPFIYGWCW